MPDGVGVIEDLQRPAAELPLADRRTGTARQPGIP
jgi:hypothetical protein